MRLKTGSVTSTGQVLNKRDKVAAIEFHARGGNVGSVVFGDSDVNATNGRELKAGESDDLSFNEAEGGGSVAFNVFYVHIANGGDIVDYVAILF